MKVYIREEYIGQDVDVYDKETMLHNANVDLKDEDEGIRAIGEVEMELYNRMSNDQLVVWESGCEPTIEERADVTIIEERADVTIVD